MVAVLVRVAVVGESVNQRSFILIRCRPQKLNISRILTRPAFTRLQDSMDTTSEYIMRSTGH